MIGNVPLLRKALEHITEHPEEHNQGEWAVRLDCGTAGCLAYWMAIFAGYEVDWEYGYWELSGAPRAEYTVSSGHIADVAAREAGLTRDQANKLFFGGNSIDQLWELATRFTNGEISRERVA